MHLYGRPSYNVLSKKIKTAVVCHIGIISVTADHPRSQLADRKMMLKYHVDQICSFEDYCHSKILHI